MKDKRIRLEESAGGVVFRMNGERVEVLIAQHASHKGWGFPKGHIGDRIQGEGKEETAVREVREEAGVRAEILQPLSPVTYFYTFNGEKRRKIVSFFLMKFLDEDRSQKDAEMQDVGWFLEEDVANRLTHPTEKKLWIEARQLIAASY